MDFEKSKIKKSRFILELTPNKKYTLDELKKKYRIAALKYHPDKHFNSDDAKAKFQEINEAYIFLCGKYDTDADKRPEYGNYCKDEYCYSELFSSFINSLMKDFSKTKVTELNVIIQVLMNKCVSITSTIFDNMDKESLLFIYNLIMKYDTILDIGGERLNRVISLIKNKLQMNDVIIIRPTISELFDVNNIQVVEHENKTYYVPLWHTELYYGISNNNNKQHKDERELIVKCIPKLPEYIYIDEANNIYVDVRTRVENLFNQTTLSITLADSVSFDIPVNTLEFKTNQTITLTKCGIPVINTENIYDVSERMNVIIHLEVLI
jgi:curved DNA-binding protein CbpA